MRARTPRPVAPAVSPTLALHRPAARSALARGPADVVHARSVLGNAAVTAALGGPEPAPSVWAGQMLLEGQGMVGNQAVVNGAATAPVLPGTSPGVPPASATPPAVPPAVESKKPEPPKPKAPEARPSAPKTAPPPAAKPEVKDQKEKPPAERQGKEAKKTEAGPRRSPAADPKFQALRKDVNAKKRAVGSSHPPPATEAGAAQAASVPPADDQEARGKAAHAEDMDAAEPKAFDKQAFIDAVKKAIADRAPKNLEEADEFGGSGKAEEVKGEVQGKVGEGKEASAKDIAETTAEPPQPAPDKKEVVPMAGDKVPGKPGTPNPSQATPDALPASATDMSEGPAQVNDQMASAQVTEQQLSFENSREPKFDKAVQNKKEMDTHSAEAPGELRRGESKELKGVKTTAAAKGASAMTSIHGTRVATGKKVGTGKEGTKSQDEEKRTQVTAVLQKVFDKTKCDVEKILSDLDKAVDHQFTTGEKQARDKFTREHEAGMRRYKAERYSAWNGAYLWAKDKLLDLPEEANRIYERARDNYLAAMEQVIKDIAGTVERELNRAKDRISAGRKELKEAVDKLPKDLQAIGREAVSDFEGKFDELKDTVNDKGTELVDTLATKYTEAVKSVDEEIAKEKEKNKGLVTKAAEAIGDVIETIKELGRMLMNILRKAATAIGLILRDPIGFLDRLIAGVGGGLKLFAKNAGRHLQQGVLAWLLGSGATAGMQMPTTFDILGILLMIAALLGISWPSIRAKLVRRVPNKAVVAAETAIPLVAATKSSGVKGMWPDLKGRVGDLKKNLISDLVSYLLPTIILAGITWIISLFNPASAFIRACKAIIDIVRFIVTNARLIIDFVNAVLDAIIAIARGGGGAPALIERALAKSIPVLIGALAALLGIGGIAGKVKQVFQKISRPVKRAIDAVVKKITDLIKKLWAKIKPKPKKPKKVEKPKKEVKEPEPAGKLPSAKLPAAKPKPTKKPSRPPKKRPTDRDRKRKPSKEERRRKRGTRPDRRRLPDRKRRDPAERRPDRDKKPPQRIGRGTPLEVEFLKGHPIEAWRHDPRHNPLWRPGSQDHAAAYTKGADPDVKAKFSIAGAPPTKAIRVWVRVREGGAVLGKTSELYRGGVLDVSGLKLNGLSRSAAVGERPYRLVWHASVNQRVWTPLGTTGEHPLFWVFATPPEVLKSFGVSKATRYAEGLSSPPAIAEALRRGIRGDLNYDPKDLVNDDPLEVLTDGVGICTDFANLLTMLARTVGLAANPLLFFGGFQTLGTNIWVYLQGPYVTLTKVRSPYPHLNPPGQPEGWAFTYHAITRVEGVLHDAALNRTGIEAQAALQGTEVQLVELTGASLPTGRAGHPYTATIPRVSHPVEVSIRHYTSYLAGPAFARLELQLPLGVPSPVRIPVDWLMQTGALPPGLVLGNGRIDGTPRREGTYTFTVGVHPARNPSLASSTPFTIVVNR